MVLQKRQNVTSKHHTDLSKTQNNGKISVLKKMELARGREMAQIKKKKWQTSSQREDSSVRHFPHQLTIA